MVVGNFGVVSGRQCGQTVKTQQICKMLGNTWQVIELNSEEFKTKPIATLYTLIASIFKADAMVMLPAQSLLPYMVLFSSIVKLFSKKITVYSVIGGWLPNYLERRKVLRWLVRRVDAILVETKGMQKLLQNQRITSLVVPNSKDFSLDVVNQLKSNINNVEDFTYLNQCVYIGRVTAEKGVGYALEAVAEFNKLTNSRIILDVFGPIDIEYKKEFESLLEKYSSDVRYKGVIQSHEVQRQIGKYDALLFPTFYKGEGFPGVLIDSFSAGLPVIASNWAYNKEFIKHGVNGFIVNVKDTSSIVAALLELYGSDLSSIKRSCLNSCADFHSDKVGKDITTIVYGLLKG
nr:glycosyltransferase family 4 protein [Reinekea sp. G2M2-21]